MPSIWTLGQDQPVIPGVPCSRWATALPHATAGSLVPAFAPARHVCLTVKHPCALTLGTWLPTRLRVPLGASVTFWEATAPVKLPTRRSPVSGSRHQVKYPERPEGYFTDDSTTTSVTASHAPTYPTQADPNTN